MTQWVGGLGVLYLAVLLLGGGAFGDDDELGTDLRAETGGRGWEREASHPCDRSG